MNGKILVIGASGQIGTELVIRLREIYGTDNVIASDIRDTQIKQHGIFENLNILDNNQLLTIVKKYNVQEVYLLAAFLSVTAEKNPAFAWELNMNGLFNVLNLAKDKIIDKVFWPSSIAVFGPTTPKNNTPQSSIMEPTTVYGISKLAGERWCDYYHTNYNVDVRSIRYPGLIGYKSLPGGGTTDYAVDIFYQAIKSNSYTCFLSADTELPMMFMEDAIEATIKIMQAPIENIKVRSSYNLSGISFTPQQLADELKKYKSNFIINYQIDERQKIAESWPNSINDQDAQNDWGWKASFTLSELCKVMLSNLEQKLIENNKV